MSNKERLTIVIDPELKQAVKDHGAQPEIDRPMSWLIIQWIKEGLGRGHKEEEDGR